MTTPNIDAQFEMPIYSYTLVGGAAKNDNSRVTSGNTGTDNSMSIKLPLGENLIRVTTLGVAASRVWIVAAGSDRGGVLVDWKTVGENGFIFAAPNDLESTWIALRSDTPGALYGLTIINTPPKA